MNDAFDKLAIVNHVVFVNLGQRPEIVAVGQHHPGGHFPLGHQPPDFGKILFRRITAAHHGRLFLMKLRVRDLQLTFKQANKDDAAAVAD